MRSIRCRTAPPPPIPADTHAARRCARLAARAISRTIAAYRARFSIANTASSSHASSAAADSVRSSHHDSGWNQKRAQFRRARNALNGSRRRACASSCASTARSVSRGHVVDDEGSRTAGRIDTDGRRYAECRRVTNAGRVRRSGRHAATQDACGCEPSDQQPDAQYGGHRGVDNDENRRPLLASHAAARDSTGRAPLSGPDRGLPMLRRRCGSRIKRVNETRRPRARVDHRHSRDPARHPQAVVGNRQVNRRRDPRDAGHGDHREKHRNPRGMADGPRRRPKASSPW